jgi:probable F420-dependent oxidoreductase
MMQLGLSLPTFGPLANPDSLRVLATHAEAAGFESLWVPDHVALPLTVDSRYPYSASGRPSFAADTDWLDPFLALGWLAAATSRVRLGTSVLVLPLRHPLLVAKAAATLDRLSGGRLILGVGAGWLQEEFTLLGQPFAERGARTTEAIRLMRACWGDNPVRFAGEHFRLAEFAMSPKPLQGAALPIHCGGHSTAALRRLAAVGDGWQPIIDPDGFAERRSVLERELHQAGRSLADVDLTVRPGREHPLTPDLLKRYSSVGVRMVVAGLRGASLDEALREIDRLAALAPS